MFLFFIIISLYEIVNAPLQFYTNSWYSICILALEYIAVYKQYATHHYNSNTRNKKKLQKAFHLNKCTYIIFVK